ncbi:MAG: transcription antitermination factor NusB [Nitrospirae bacterium]|nr:MAG: transcription antitermination factor NusB [Nitrospirota bacterium]
MGARSKGRELALQFLYGREYVAGDWAEDQARFLAASGRGERARAFAHRLLSGLARHLEAVDRDLARLAPPEWPVARMGRTDRAILRLGLYELLYDRATPPKVVIDEAVELAKRYGDADAYRFVNGILHTAYRELQEAEGA